MDIITIIFNFLKKFFTTVEKCEILHASIDEGFEMKKIIDAVSDKRGNITSVLLEGDATFILVNEAIERTKNGEIDAQVITRTVEVEYLRTKADGIKENNLDYLAENNK